MKRTRLAAAVALSLVLPACFGPDPNLTDDGKGKPLITADFPGEVDAGSVATATLTVENPGPGDIGSVAIAFAGVGAPAASGPLPVELVPITTSPDNPAIRSVEPEPRKVSDDGVVYFFGVLPEGEALEVAFEIVAPDEPGPAASSVSVYDGTDTDRIRGLRLATEVTG
ncbi:MAG TPA: hypothetical protein VG318_13135 [Actinomycetota bacterium]|nr:hypothetical protein [Actinomycetota bacterium]